MTKESFRTSFVIPLCFVIHHGAAFLLTNKDRRRKYKHELTNHWITCRGNSFWHFCARSWDAALHARQSDRCHLSDTDGGELGGARHWRRTLHLAVDTLFHARRLRNVARSVRWPHHAGIGHAKPRTDRSINEPNGGNGACR